MGDAEDRDEPVGSGDGDRGDQGFHERFGLVVGAAGDDLGDVIGYGCEGSGLGRGGFVVEVASSFFDVSGSTMTILSTLHEGWSRCAAEAILLDLPCITSGTAGLGDLARLTNQPIADLPRLAEQLHARARTPAAVTAEARQRLAAFDVPYFTSAWRHLLLNTMRNLDEPPQSVADLRQARDGQPRLLT
ncbi:MAG: hypothetical protein ACRDRP_00450 [Pseudonocardiaceae bacterium]